MPFEDNSAFNQTENSKSSSSEVAQPGRKRIQNPSSTDGNCHHKNMQANPETACKADMHPNKPLASEEKNMDEKKFNLIPKIEQIKQEESHPVLITNEMLLEEKKLAEQTKKEEIKIMQEAERQLAEQNKEMRLERLKNLLTKSTFYTEFIVKRLDEHKKNEMKLSSKKSLEKTPNSTKKKPKAPSPKEGGTLKKDKASQDKHTLSSPTEGKFSIQKAPESEQSTKTRITELGIEVSERQPLLFEGGTMRNYQLEGFEWLRLLYMNGVNGILADEMGLGKTIQCIALVCSMIEQGVASPVLVIGPLSTLPNWVSEFERFAPKVPVILYHGNAEERKSIQREILTRNKYSISKDLAPAGVSPVIITSYEVVMRDRAYFQKKNWSLIILDEGHRIKNFQCRLVRELKQLKSDNRLLLTGTPLQNNLTELWSLLNYLLPEIFSDLAVFESWFEVEDLQENANDANHRIIQMEEKEHILATLHKILTPFMLRRVKADVELGIPPKKELLVFTPMTPVQDELYRAILDQTIFNIVAPENEEDLPTTEETGNRRKRRRCDNVKCYDDDIISYDEFEKRLEESAKLEKPKTFKTSYRELTSQKGYLVNLNPCSPAIDLRKVVNHPYLIKLPVLPGTKEFRIDEELVTSCGKMLVLDAMLSKLKLRGHKVLIFSQMVSLLDLIEEYVILRGYKYGRLDGTRSTFNRQENIKEFNTNPECFLFLISTRAGGLGINLTAADTVIIYDSDWNPQSDLQAQDRCHRIGQTKPVVVYRLTTDGTIDRRMIERASGKRRLEKIVIQKGRFNNKNLSEEGSGLSAKELLALLNSSDFVKKIQSNGFVFTDQELDELLDRSDMVSGKAAALAPGKPAPSHLFEVV